MLEPQAREQVRASGGPPPLVDDVDDAGWSASVGRRRCQVGGRGPALGRSGPRAHRARHQATAAARTTSTGRGARSSAQVVEQGQDAALGPGDTATARPDRARPPSARAAASHGRVPRRQLVSPAPAFSASADGPADRGRDDQQPGRQRQRPAEHDDARGPTSAATRTPKAMPRAGACGPVGVRRPAAVGAGGALGGSARRAVDRSRRSPPGRRGSGVRGLGHAAIVAARTARAERVAPTGGR